MARATKHPDTGIYQYRKRVPPDVRALAGGPTHVKVSLGTREPREAERLFREADAKHEERWAQVRLGIQDLDDRQVAALAGEVYRAAIIKAGNDRDAGTQRPWSILKARCDLLDREEATMTEPHWMYELDQLHGGGVDEVLDRRGMKLSEDTLGRLLTAVHREMKNAIGVVARQARGDWSPDANLARFPGIEVIGTSKPEHQFAAVWERWLNEAKPSDGTVRRWKPVLDRMFGTVGTTDMSRITEKQLSDWIDGLLLGLHNNSVGRVDLAAAKRMFRFAKQKRIIPVDPTVDLKVSSGTKFETKMRGFEAHEAEIVLRATLLPPSGRTSPTLAAARRWVPWICAYTGARVNEVTQARACDFSIVSGMTILHITAEAGTAKSGDRKVPLHPHLMEQGFGTFLGTKKGDEPLFYVPRERKTAAAIPPYAEMGGRLSKWVRGLGLVDKNLDPNHAWRHRFKTEAGDADIQERVVDAIQGHAPTSQGRRYGEVSLKQRSDAIRRMPRIAIGNER